MSKKSTFVWFFSLKSLYYQWLFVFLQRQSSPSLLTMLKSCEAFFVYTHNLYRVLPSGFGYWWRTQRVWRIQRNLHSKSWWKHKHWDMDQCRWHSPLVIRLSLYHHWPKSPVFEIECINLCSEKNFVCRQYKRKNAQYEEIAVYAEKGKDLVQLSEITRHARHNAQVSKSLCSVRFTSKRLAGRGFSSFLPKRNTLTTRKKHNENGARIDKGDGMGIGSSRPFFGRWKREARPGRGVSLQ